jgi:predicted nuclease of predicted toxin-antitoxin system
MLIDANLSPRVAERLRTAGFQATHVADVDLLTATDDQILRHAMDHGLIVITADSDFAMILALSGSATPSVIHLRYVAELGVDAHVDLLVANLPQIENELATGAIASLSPGRLSTRNLPIM